MIELLILWTYMLILSTIIGAFVLFSLERIVGKKLLSGKSHTSYSFMGLQLAALCFITFLSQVWSLFGRVYIEAHLFVLFGCIILMVLGSRKKTNLLSNVYTYVVASAKKFFKLMLSWEGALYLILILITTFYASRGNQHTDTYIYHAEMIRWYEEYGLVTGMGNLQNHFAYNSAYLGYASFWSMKWLLGQSLHGTNGYIQALLVVWSTHGLLRFKSHTNLVPDACRLAIIIYSIVNSEYIMSPATDFGALYLILWIVTLWADISFNKVHSEAESIYLYALLCIASCIALEYKLSAGLIVVITIYPAIYLIKNKQFRTVLSFLCLGIIVLLPWIIRNIIISGCIIYPITSLRLSFLDWAIPTSVFVEDNSLISTWGKCLFDATRANDPIIVWYPIWWDYKDTYEKMLIISNLLAICLEFVWILDRIIHKKELSKAWAIMKFSFLICLILWFVKAPFIRYSLAFLLLVPLCEITQWLKRKPSFEISGPISIISGFGVIAIALTLLMYINYYTLVDVNLAKANLSEPYYVVQKDYAQVDYQTYVMDGITIYYPAYESDNSYAPIPSTAYIGMATRTKLRGDSLDDGFMPKE